MNLRLILIMNIKYVLEFYIFKFFLITYQLVIDINLNLLILRNKKFLSII